MKKLKFDVVFQLKYEFILNLSLSIYIYIYWLYIKDLGKIFRLV